MHQTRQRQSISPLTEGEGSLWLNSIPPILPSHLATKPFHLGHQRVRTIHTGPAHDGGKTISTFVGVVPALEDGKSLHDLPIADSVRPEEAGCR